MNRTFVLSEFRVHFSAFKKRSKASSLRAIVAAFIFHLISASSPRDGAALVAPNGSAPIVTLLLWPLFPKREVAVEGLNKAADEPVAAVLALVGRREDEEAE